MKTLYICRMQVREDSALKVADFLLQIKAIQISPETPFTWASGLKSPIYCDNRKTLSHPGIRTFIRQQFTAVIEANWSNVEVVAGVATGGVAPAALVAQEMGLPMIYVRSSVKEHGLQRMVEGVLLEGQKVVILEDLVSTGKSSLNAAKALRDAGADVLGMVAIFTYGFQEAIDRFSEEDIALHVLTDYSSLLAEAIRQEYINDRSLEALNRWRQDHRNWDPKL